VRRNDVLRPTRCPWTHSDEADVVQFVYVVPLQRDASDALLFVKHFRSRSCPETRSLVYCGTLSVSDSTPLRDRVKHVLRMCDSSPTPEHIQIFEILSKKAGKVLDVSMSIQDLGLLSGSVIVLQDNKIDYNAQLAFPPYGRTLDPLVAAHNPVLHSLFVQVMHGEFTYVVLSSAPTTSPPFQVAAHKCIFASLPYFKTAFTNGTSESKSGCSKSRNPDRCSAGRCCRISLFPVSSELCPSHQISTYLISGPSSFI
jgi:ICP0-binding domain of Ubiquitin-specific protease 7